MKYLNLRPTSALLYLLQHLRKCYDDPKNAVILCDALKYAAEEPGLDYKSIFEELNSPGFIEKCSAEEYPGSPEVISFALKDKDEQNYLKAYSMIQDSRIAARPHHTAVCKAVLYAYLCHITERSRVKADFEVPFDDLTTDEKLALIDAKLSYLTLLVQQIKQQK